MNIWIFNDILIGYLYPYSAGIDFGRQNLTSVDIRHQMNREELTNKTFMMI